MPKELSFREAILTVRDALDKLTVVGSQSARILSSACDDLATIAQAIDEYVKSATGGGEKNDTKTHTDSHD